MASNDKEFGNSKRFSGDALDPLEYRRWRLWVEARMASQKDLQPQQRGPFVFCLLDGTALETVEHLSLDQLKEENGDKHLWKALDERFPDKLKHDWLAECLKEIFTLSQAEGETIATWTSKVQEAFAKCKRKVEVDFPSEARGWICLNASSLSEDQRAIVTAKTQGDFKIETVVAAMRSCFPDFKATAKYSKPKPVTAFLAQDELEVPEEDCSPVEGPDAVVFDDLEAFLADHGVSDRETQSNEVFDELETAEILAATWREKRSEISKLQKARRFSQVGTVKKQFQQDIRSLKSKTKCFKCHQVGHWSKDCPNRSSRPAKSEGSQSASGAAMVEDGPQSHDEVMLVSSPGFGIVDSGCSRTLIGQETLNSFMRLYHEKCMPEPTDRKECNLFRFGNGHEEVSERVVSMPVSINGQKGRIDAAVIKGSAPLLLSRNTMKSLNAVLDFSSETMSLGGGPPRKLQVNSAGQYVIDVLNVEAEAMVADVKSQEDKQHTLSRKQKRTLLANQQAWMKSQGKCTVAELFSPPRFAKVAEAEGQKGLSFDIQQGWDLLSPKVQKQVDEMLNDEMPELLVCCPECKHWGGWYRLNQHKLSMVEQLHNKKVAEKQADFVAQQVRKQLHRGGRVLIEHPWTSDMWKHPSIAKLLDQGLLRKCKAHMCAYGLVDPDTSQPIKKMTGLAVSHQDMESLALTCPGHESHKVIEGKCHDGENLSTKTARYTDGFVQTWYSCVRPEMQLCHFTCLQEPNVQTDLSVAECCAAVSDVAMPADESPAEDHVAKVKSSLKRLHANLGHPSTRSLKRILKNAGASEQAMKLADQIEASCDICQQRVRPTPALPAAPNHFQDFNARIGWDVKSLPGWRQNQRVKCLNIVDFASSYQVMIPFFEKERAELLKELYLKGWQHWAGVPVEVLVDPARTNTAESVFAQLETDGARVITTAAEAHNQLGKVEKHGHLFETVLTKMLDQVQPQNQEEYEQCVIQTMNAKNELLNNKGMSPCQLVFGRNPRVPADLLQENPCPVAGTTPLHDASAARAHEIRTQARIALVQSQDDISLRTALAARPRAERDFLAGDYVAYWRSQKYEKGVRMVGGRWYGTAIVMGKLGRNFLICHRKNLFKVAPEHLRHITTEERMLAQTDGRELLGIDSLVNTEQKKLLGSQFVDLTQQSGPEGRAVQRVESDPGLLEDHWVQRGELLCRIHKSARTTAYMPDPSDPIVQNFNFEDWRATYVDGSLDPIVHKIFSEPLTQRIEIQQQPWRGESHFKVRKVRDALTPEERGVIVVPGPTSTMSSPSDPNPDSTNVTSSESHGETDNRAEPFPTNASSQVGGTGGSTGSYGPVRIRHNQKGPESLWLRPPATQMEDLREILSEVHGTKRSQSREPSAEPPNKSAKVDDADVCLLAECSSQPLEILIANFLKKKMAKELHHSNNPPILQEKVDASKVTEWTTLRDEKEAIKVILPAQAKRIRAQRPDRIMTSHFVVTEKHEDGDSKIKSRWCLRGHHDPDLIQKVLAGKCHSPTLSQFGRSLILQLLVSHQWLMNLGDIKGAFLEANVREKALQNPVYAELPPGGVPGIPEGSLVQVLGNIYGANDAPHEWYQEFDRVAQKAGFTRSKFDACLYFCYGGDGSLQGVLGAHVDDTITGGQGDVYEAAVGYLKQRFPFRKWRTGSGEFLGTVYTQCPSTFEITYSQKEYAENIRPIPVSKERTKQPSLPASEKEISALRAVNGALGWLSTQTRPDLSVQTSLSQQCFPKPTVFDLLQANQAVRRARQQADFQIKVPYIAPDELTLCFWSDAAFANTTELKTQGGWIVAFTSNRMSKGEDVPVFCFAWKSYRLPRVVSSTLSGEAQAFATASGVCEWISLMVSEALDGVFSLEDAESVLLRRKPLGMSDCLEPRWCATGHMVADGLTKDKSEPMDLLRSVIRAAKYQLADEQAVLDRKRAEKLHRKQRATQRAEANGVSTIQEE
eukprot:s612_g25.t2